MDGVTLAAPRIDTHISHVFLTQDRVYKMKRPVKLPFLDFTTVALRHRACLAELEANRLLAPGMYLGVEPIVAAGGGRYRIGGPGEPLDWVVVMKRFDQADQFDELARAGRLTPELIDQTADVIAAAHAAAVPVPTAGHTADYRGIIRELRATEIHGAHQMDLDPGDPAVFDLLDAELAHIDPLIEARRRAGKVHRTHADLHLRNICLFEGRPTPFDAMEFDVHMATIDRLYDLGFLLMDLVRMDHGADANRLMNRYWDTSGEEEGAFRVLPFFMALRAVVRFAVSVEEGKLGDASAYRQLALKLLTPEPPRSVCVGGLSGVGKTTIARAIAAHLPGPAGGRLLRTDVLRKQALGQNPEAPARMPGGLYSEVGRASVYDVMFQHSNAALDAGISTVLDATFQSEMMRFEGAAHRYRQPTTGIWLEAPLEVRLARIAGRRGDASDADAEVARAQQEPEVLDKFGGWHRVDASGTVEETIANALAVLA
ncbi:MAG: AAA family ATPase [Hyphomonas sp.]|uniref:bifunctional aminoglycoside phosphotransferase/ATP-binding protein n=1 Tax=Hyphomonas sp. TaxID=87 RepID=UPI0035276082